MLPIMDSIQSWILFLASCNPNILYIFPAPRAYQHDCECLIGLAPRHKFLKSEAKKKARLSAKELWEKEYPSEPYDVDYSSLDEDPIYK